jgi:hypothetical protein
VSVDFDIPTIRRYFGGFRAKKNSICADPIFRCVRRGARVGSDRAADLCIGGREMMQPWTPVVVDASRWGLEAWAVRADASARHVYVGGRSHDLRRRNLSIFSVETDGTVKSPPVKFADHPEPLVPNIESQWSQIHCIASDVRWPNKLYLGLETSGNQVQFDTPLVVYDLNSDGLPEGQPRAFNIMNPFNLCWRVAFHPFKSVLYATGFGFPAVAAWRLDSAGEPVGPVSVFPVGATGKRSVSVTPDGTKMCLGSYPWLLEIVLLDSDGLPLKTIASHSLSHRDNSEDYARLAVSDGVAYYVDKQKDGALAYFGFDSSGQPTTSAVNGFPARTLAPDLVDGKVLIGVDHTFTDALNSAIVTDGTVLQEIALDAAGVPNVMVRQSELMLREEAQLISAVPTAAAAAIPLTGFPGNRIAGLGVHVSVPRLEAIGPLVLDATATTICNYPQYLRFAYAPTRDALYVAAPTMISVVARGAPSTAPQRTFTFEKWTDVLCVDEVNGRLYAARTDGRIAVFDIDAGGLLSPPSEILSTGLATVLCLCLHPTTGQLYALGPSSGQVGSTVDPRIIAVPSGGDFQQAVVSPEFGRLYVCTRYNAHENLWVWQLGPDQHPIGDPQTFSDGLPTGLGRGLVDCLQLDGDTLYLGGYSENWTSSNNLAAGILVYSLDADGLPTGTAPTMFASQHRVTALAIGGDHLYESGYGDPTIVAWTLHANGGLTGEQQAATTGTFGKKQLTVSGDGFALLVGTYPSILEEVPLLADGRLLAGAHATFAVGSGPAVALGVLGPAIATQTRIDLDGSLRDKVGTALASLTLFTDAGTVTAARIRFDVSRVLKKVEQPVRSVTAAVYGQVAALLLPYYGLDRESDLAERVEGSAEHYERYRRWAVEAANRAAQLDSSAARPTRTIVANTLLGLDGSTASLRAGLEAIGLLGHNTAHAWAFGGVSDSAIASATVTSGFNHFVYAIYAPPSYFAFDSMISNPQLLDNWASDQASQIASKVTASLDKLALFHLADEPGWYYPQCLDDVRADADALAAFRAYLTSTGLPASAFGQLDFNQIEPGRLSQATGSGAPVEQKRLLYWTTRFFTESFSAGFAAMTTALRSHINSALLTTTNINNVRYFTPSPNAKIASNQHTGPDAAMGGPDWFDLGRKQAVTCLWTEDWFLDQSAQMWSFYGDLLRCAAANGGVGFGGYVVGRVLASQPASLPEGATYKAMSLVGRGARALDFYTFDQGLIFGDSWSDLKPVYEAVAGALGLLGRAESLLGAPGVARRGTVALLFPQASQVWDGGSAWYQYMIELRGTHAAIMHAQYPVDFVDDMDVEQGALSKRGYRALYVSAPNLSAKAQNAIQDWVSSGGTLVLLPGACKADEYDEGLYLLTAAAGVTSPPVVRVPAGTGPGLLNQPAPSIQPVDARFPPTSTHPRFQIVPLTPIVGDATVLATFTDGSAAAVLRTVGTAGGQIFSFGFWPGLTYWASPDFRIEDADPTQPTFPQNWASDMRAVVTMPAQLSGARKHAKLSADGVEVLVMDAPDRIMVTLLNWFTPLSDPQLLKVQPPIPVVPQDMWTATSVKRGTLPCNATADGIEVTLPSLETVDVVVISRTSP